MQTMMQNTARIYLFFVSLRVLQRFCAILALTEVEQSPMDSLKEVHLLQDVEMPIQKKTLIMVCEYL